MNISSLLQAPLSQLQLIQSTHHSNIYIPNHSNQTVALKIVHAPDQQQALLHQLFSHPNIITYLAHSFNHNQLRIIMEHADGGDMSKMILEQHQLWDLAGSLASALQLLHANNIMHGDVKPSNLLLHKHVVKLADFGLARDITQKDELCVKGTPFYLPPEAIEGEMTLASDIWGMGCTIFQLSTGKKPFKGSTLSELCDSINNDQPYLKSSVRMDRLIERMLEKDVSKRADIKEVIEMLREGGKMQMLEQVRTVRKKVQICLREQQPTSKKGVLNLWTKQKLQQNSLMAIIEQRKRQKLQLQ